MEFHSLLKRYLHQRVCLELRHRCILWGTLKAVSRDCLQLVETLMIRDPDDQGWFEYLQNSDGESNRGPRYPETIVRLDDVLAATCVAEDLPHMDAENPNCTTETQPLGSGRVTLVKSNESLATSLRRLSTGLRVSSADEQAEMLPDREVDPICVELGCDLISLADPRNGGDLLERITHVRKVVAAETGVVIPRIRIRDNLRLDPRAYRFTLSGHVTAHGEIHKEQLMMIDLAGGGTEIPGDEFREPAYGLKAKWIEPALREQAEMSGCSVCDCTTVMSTHLTEVLKSRLHQLLRFDAVQKLIEDFGQANPGIVAELISEQRPLAVLHRFLIRLLEERVTIRNLGAILESIAFQTRSESFSEAAMRRVRIDLGREICGPLSDEHQALRAMIVSPSDEKELRQELIASPRKGGTLVSRFAQRLEDIREPRVLLVSDEELRRELFLAISRLTLRVHIVAAAEIPIDCTLIPTPQV